MSGVDVCEMAIGVESRAEERYEAVRSGALDEDFVEARDDFGERQVAGELGLERALGHCGEQSGGDSLARHVAERERGAVVPERNEVVEIAPDVARRDVVGGDLEIVRDVECRRRERDLHLARHAEFLLDLLLLPLLDRKSTRLNSSHLGISYAVFCLKKKI